MHNNINKKTRYIPTAAHEDEEIKTFYKNIT